MKQLTEDTSIETTESKEIRKKRIRWKNVCGVFRGQWDNIKTSNIHIIITVYEGKKCEKGA